MPNQDLQPSESVHHVDNKTFLAAFRVQDQDPNIQPKHSAQLSIQQQLRNNLFPDPPVHGQDSLRRVTYRREPERNGLCVYSDLLHTQPQTAPMQLQVDWP